MTNDQQIIQALTQSPQPDIEEKNDGRVTFIRRELEALWGIGERPTRRKIRELIDTGVLEPDYVWRPMIHGGGHRVKGYVFTGEIKDGETND